LRALSDTGCDTTYFGFIMGRRVGLLSGKTSGRQEFYLKFIPVAISQIHRKK